MFTLLTVSGIIILAAVIAIVLGVVLGSITVVLLIGKYVLCALVMYKAIKLLIRTFKRKK